MTAPMQPPEAAQQYRLALEDHYKSKALLDALTRYRGVISAYPNAPEAAYARVQIQNIAQAVVAKEQLFAAQLSLVIEHFEANKVGTTP